MANKWSRADAPPPPLFVNEAEKDFIKQVGTELLERVIGTTVMYYPLDIQGSNYHQLYGEAIEKVYLSPIRIFVLVKYEGSKTETNNLGVDKYSTLEVWFPQRRLTEDQNLNVMEGDIIFFGSEYYEIFELNSPNFIFGDPETKVEIIAKCRKARENFFLGDRTQ